MSRRRCSLESGQITVNSVSTTIKTQRAFSLQDHEAAQTFPASPFHARAECMGGMHLTLSFIGLLPLGKS